MDEAGGIRVVGAGGAGRIGVVEAGGIEVDGAVGIRGAS